MPLDHDPGIKKFFDAIAETPIDDSLYNQLQTSLLDGCWELLRLAKQAEDTSRLPALVLGRVPNPPATPAIRLPELIMLKLTNPSRGEFVIWNAWQQGLTPRVYVRGTRDRNSGYITIDPRWVLSFIAGAGEGAATAPARLSAVAQSSGLLPSFVRDDPNVPGRGVPLADIARDLSREYDEIPILVQASLLGELVPLRFETPVSLAYILDAVAVHVRGRWDWSDDRIVIQRAWGGESCLCG